jgi:hypothetical protein
MDSLFQSLKRYYLSPASLEPTEIAELARPDFCERQKSGRKLNRPWRYLALCFGDPF